MGGFCFTLPDPTWILTGPILLQFRLKTPTAVDGTRYNTDSDAGTFFGRQGSGVGY
jgi:hypothetical protein